MSGAVGSPLITRWWLIRHAPVSNPDGLIYGASDPAADVGDAEALAVLAAALPPDALWLCTPRRRTRQTAVALRPAVAGTLLEEPDLAEQDFGAWEGLSHDDAAARFPEEARRFWRAPATEAPPDGESFAAVMARVAGAVRRRTAASGGRDLVAVVHGGTVRAALALALDLTPAASLRVAVAPLSLTRIDHIGGLENGEEAWAVGAVNTPGPFAG